MKTTCLLANMNTRSFREPIKEVVTELSDAKCSDAVFWCCLIIGLENRHHDVAQSESYYEGQ